MDLAEVSSWSYSTLNYQFIDFVSVLFVTIITWALFVLLSEWVPKNTNKFIAHIIEIVLTYSVRCKLNFSIAPHTSLLPFPILPLYLRLMFIYLFTHSSRESNLNEKIPFP